MSLFLSFEGGEGAGKTTLIERIEKYLTAEGLSVIRTREPGGTDLGEKIRSLLLQPSEATLSPYAELCLFLASRAQHVQQVIRPALQQGKVVLCDRFHDSTIAYQGAARGLGMEEVARFSSFVTQGLEPSLTFYLDIDPAIGLKRAADQRHSKDRIESETIAFHQKIRQAYHTLHKMHPQRLRMLDAHKTPDEVFHQTLEYLGPLLCA